MSTLVAVTVEVEMRAFPLCRCGHHRSEHRPWANGDAACAYFGCECLDYDEEIRVRQVTIPASETGALQWSCLDTEMRLELTFKWGQNDFQPQRMPSVSVNDVIRLDGRRWRVAPDGFRVIPMNRTPLRLVLAAADGTVIDSWSSDDDHARDVFDQVVRAVVVGPAVDAIRDALPDEDDV